MRSWTIPNCDMGAQTFLMLRQSTFRQAMLLISVKKIDVCFYALFCNLTSPLFLALTLGSTRESRDLVFPAISFQWSEDKNTSSPIWRVIRVKINCTNFFQFEFRNKSFWVQLLSNCSSFSSLNFETSLFAYNYCLIAAFSAACFIVNEVYLGITC